MTKHLTGMTLICGLVAVSLSFTEHGHRSVILASRVVDEPAWLQMVSSRPFAPRFSFWTSHRPFVPSASSVPQGSVAASRSPSEQGVLYLLDGRLKGAISILEKAVAEEPSNPALLSDLAAAYLVRADQENGAYAFDRVQALSLLERAVAAAPDSQPVLFNRALALEEIGLWREALKAWDRYLLGDGSSGWADEALARRSELKQKLGAQASWKQIQELLDQVATRGSVPDLMKVVGGFRQQVRIHAEEVVLSRWAAFVLEGRAEAAERELTIARTIAALVEERGDRLLKDAVSSIDDATRRGDQHQIKNLAEAHVAFRQGLDRYEPIDLVGARPKLTAAQDAFERGGSPLALWASFYLAICDYYEGRYAESLQALVPLRAAAERQGYLSLLGRVRWMEGLGYLERTSPTEALESLNAAVETFGRLGEGENLASVHDRIAGCLSYLGETQESWRNVGRALSLRREVVSPRRLYSIFYTAQDLALHRGEPAIALYFLDETVAAAKAWGSAAAVSEVLWSRSRVLQRLGRTEDALADLRAAEVQARQIRSEPLQRRIEGDILRVTAEAYLLNDAQEAIRKLSSALELYRDTNYPDHLLSILLERGRAYERIGDDDRAEKDFRAAISLYEERREQVSEADSRISYFDQAEAAFDEMVLFQVERRGQPWRALKYVEQARARSLLDAVSGEEGLTPSGLVPLSFNIDALAERIPQDVAVIEYAVLADRLLIWIIRSEGIGFREIVVKRGQLESLVNRLRTEILRNKKNASAASDLYQLVVAPVLEDVGPDSSLVFVPDKALHRLPFAALQNPETGRFLVQNHRISIAPSTALYLLARARDAEKAARGSGGVLAIGDPLFDSGEYPDLYPLPAAVGEALKAAEVHPGAQLLLGSEATRKRFLELASGVEIIHIAAHALVNDEAPLRSKIVLAPEPGEAGSGNLYAVEIRDQRFSETRLIILGACETATGYVWKQEGIASLARAFLAAGVPAVVASLWKVDDDTTAALMAELHRHIRNGDDPIEALRKAQSSLIESSDEDLRSPKSWAAFSVVGGVISPRTGSWALTSTASGTVVVP